jgi:hypothetical protein
MVLMPLSTIFQNINGCEKHLSIILPLYHIKYVVFTDDGWRSIKRESCD